MQETAARPEASSYLFATHSLAPMHRPSTSTPRTVSTKKPGATRSPRGFFAAALALAFAALPALAQAPDAGATGVLTKPPTLLKQVEATFPAQALDAGAGGTVVMEIDIGVDGRVLDARVVQPAGSGFDEAALEAVRQFEFSPAEVDGQPAPVRITYSYEFFYRAQVVETPVDTTPDVVNFTGQLLERGTRDPLGNATVAVSQLEDVREAMSGPDGRFEFRGVPTGKVKVTVLSAQHARYEAEEELRPGQRTEVTYYVRRRQYGAYETVVKGQRERKEVAQITLKQEEIRLIPGTQGDALRVVQNLPGVARTPFSIGALVVRGGKPWDTRVYVDDAYVPLLFHFGGLYATFNSNLVDEIHFEPGNFGVEYGRNIGGLVRADSRTLSQKQLHGYFDVNAIDSSAMVEGPLAGDWSFAVGARRSYIDAVLPWVVKTFIPRANALAFTVAPRYYDYQLKLEHRPKNSRDRFWVTFFGSNDQLALVLPNPAYDPEGRNELRTLLAYNRLGINYEKQLTANLRFESHNALGYDQFAFSAGDDLFSETTAYPVTMRHTLLADLLNRRLLVTAGLDVYAIPFSYEVQSPPRIKLNQIPDPFLSRRLIKDQSSDSIVEPAVFAEAVWKPLDSLKVVAGFRADYDAYMKDLWADPRLALLWQLGEKTTLKGAAGLFHQPPDYRVGQLSAKFGNPDLLPEAGAHYSVGVEQQFTDAVSMDLQLYYKDLFHQAQATLGSTDQGVDSIDLNYTSTGVGRAYGAELLLRHQLTKNFFGWIAYSLSRSERRYRLNNTWGLHPLDQPHNLIAIASYKLPHDFIVGARLRWASGALNTPYVGAIYDANGNYFYPLPGELWSRRLPDFMQLDVRVDKRFVFERWMLALYLDVQNVTNRGNIEGVMYNHDYTEERFLYGLPILPAIGVRGEW